MEIIIIYVFFTGVLFVSWLWDTEDIFLEKVLNIIFGFINGWYATPILIGRAIRKIYKG